MSEEPKPYEVIETKWTPKETSKRIYAKKFMEFADGCLLKQMCVDYMIPCCSVSCPLERHRRML